LGPMRVAHNVSINRQTQMSARYADIKRTRHDGVRHQRAHLEVSSNPLLEHAPLLGYLLEDTNAVRISQFHVHG
jgi:hypothetical protein